MENRSQQSQNNGQASRSTSSSAACHVDHCQFNHGGELRLCDCQASSIQVMDQRHQQQCWIPYNRQQTAVSDQKEKETITKVLSKQDQSFKRTKVLTMAESMAGTCNAVIAQSK
eukprot:1234402-Amphidinium_carterae.1